MSAQKQPNNSKRSRGRPFPKGLSGNPGGRPKGESLITKLRRLLDEPATGPTDGGKTKADVLMEKAVEYASRGGKGDYSYLKEIIERVEGKTPDRLANADGSNITITVVRAPRAQLPDPTE